MENRNSAIVSRFLTHTDYGRGQMTLKKGRGGLLTSFSWQVVLSVPIYCAPAEKWFLIHTWALDAGHDYIQVFIFMRNPVSVCMATALLLFLMSCNLAMLNLFKPKRLWCACVLTAIRMLIWQPAGTRRKNLARLWQHLQPDEDEPSYVAAGVLIIGCVCVCVRVVRVAGAGFRSSIQTL